MELQYLTLHCPLVQKFQAEENAFVCKSWTITSAILILICYADLKLKVLSPYMSYAASLH